MNLGNPLRDFNTIKYWNFDPQKFSIPYLLVSKESIHRISQIFKNFKSYLQKN